MVGEVDEWLIVLEDLDGARNELAGDGLDYVDDPEQSFYYLCECHVEKKTKKMEKMQTFFGSWCKKNKKTGYYSCVTETSFSVSLCKSNKFLTQCFCAILNRVFGSL